MSLPLASDPVITGMTNDTGTGQDGDVVNKATFEALAAAIDEFCVDSDTPSSQTPGETTAEVRDARGAKADLNARISGVIDENGLLISDSKVVDVRGVCGEDIADLEVAYLSRGLGGNTQGLWYRGDASFQYASAAARLVGICIGGAASGQSVYFRILGEMDGFTGLNPGIEYYISETAGELTDARPAIGRSVAVARSTESLYVTNDLMSAGTMRGVPGMRISSDSTTVSTSGTGTTETDLVSHSIEGSTLAVNEDTISMSAALAVSNTAFDKTIRVKFGSATLAAFTIAAGAARTIRLDVEIKRTGAATQKTICSVMGVGVSEAFIQSPTETLSSLNALKITGQNTDAADVITHYHSTVRTA